MRVAYFLEWFPVPTQTFIRREIAGLIEAGVEPLVIVKRVEPYEDDEEMRLISPFIQPLFPLLPDREAEYQRRFSRQWQRYLPVYGLIRLTNYGPNKSSQEDQRILKRVSYLAGMMQDVGVTHLHAPWADAAAFEAMLSAQLADVTYSVQARASYDVYRAKARYALKQKLSHASFIITSNKYTRAHLKKLLGWFAPPMHVIYNGLDVARFVPKKRTARRVPHLISVGRLIETKGFTQLLRACHILKTRGRIFRCEIIGGKDGNYRDYFDMLMMLHRELGLEEIVSFTGHKPHSQTINAIRAADVFILPCVVARDGSRDGIPNAMLEAMALEVPVVSTTLSGIPEAVENGREGLLVPPGDVEALANALDKLMGDAELRGALGRAGRKKIESRFNIENARERYRKLFESV